MCTDHYHILFVAVTGKWVVASSSGTTCRQVCSTETGSPSLACEDPNFAQHFEDVSQTVLWLHRLVHICLWQVDTPSKLKQVADTAGVANVVHCSNVGHASRDTVGACCSNDAFTPSAGWMRAPCDASMMTCLDANTGRRAFCWCSFANSFAAGRCSSMRHDLYPL